MRMAETGEYGLTAVVINYNGGQRLLSCLQSLVDHAPLVDEFILVDNGSQDGSPEGAEQICPGLVIIRLQDNPGPATARNRGMKAAQNRRVLLVDADTQVTPGAIDELLAAQQATGAAIVCPRLVFAPENTTIQCDGAYPHFLGTLVLGNANARRDAGSAAHSVDGLISTFLLVDRDAALSAGGFNEAFFFYFEDLEFGLRMRLLGHTIACATRAVVLHDRGAGYTGLSFRGAGNYPKQRAYLSMRNRLLTIAICFHWRTILVLAPALLAYECATLGLVVLRGWIPQWAQGWAWIIANRHELRQMRNHVQHHRRLRDSAVLHGSPLPFADGLFRGRVSGALVRLLSRSFAAYWRIARVAVH